MSDTKYLVIHDGDILAKDLSAKEAVLYAAEYDGWGADFCRDEEGVLALRRSARHIGNNDWLADGSEPPLFGIVSSDVDDDEAVEEVVGKLILVIDQLHKLMDVSEISAYIKQRLQLALDEYDGDTGSGSWVVDVASSSVSGPTLPALCYKWPDDITEDHPNWGENDAPWKKWGGDIIIEAAGCFTVDGVMIDGYDCAMVELRF